jgi:multidrug efflux system membrane fusion protein
VILAALIVAVILYVLWPKLRGPAASKTASTSGKGGKGGAAGGAVNVVGTRARRGNIGVYFTGLGAVTPIYTVTVKSRVDGELIAVNYKEGDMVNKGDLLAQIDPRPYDAALVQAEGTLARDQAMLANAKIDLARYQLLIKTNAIPEQTLATQQATVDQDAGTVKLDEGSVDAAKVNVTYTKIPAPITGRVGLRLVDPGNIVQTSDSNGLVVITQMDPISVIFTVSEDQLPTVLQKMRAGQKLEVDAYDREMKTKIASGTLLTIDNQIDQTTGTVKLKAVFPNKDTALFPNQFVNARLLVDTIRDTVIIPSAALQRSPQSTFVYVVKPDSTVEMRDVQIRLSEADQTAILRGVSAGEVVVTDGVDKLQPGTKVAARKADASDGQKTSGQ